jgi:serine/threonine protein phosphatase PrpC
MILTSAGATDPGCVRSENQDRILRDDGLGFYAVCDGLGGRRCGDVAADIALSAMRRYIESSRDPMEVTWPYGYNLQYSLAVNRLMTAARIANRQVWRRSEESIEYIGMGTTIAAVLAGARDIAVVNIGDSRVYLFRNSALEQLSVDDTIAGPGEVASDNARGLVRHILTRAAGSQETVDVHVRDCAIAAGDMVLLASDGLHGCIGDAEIAALLGAAARPAAAVDHLLEASKRAGAPDNVSAIVLSFVEE